MHLLVRTKNTDTKGTVGRFTINGTTYMTMEQPWRDNTPFKSCIPVGAYELIPWKSQRYGSCFVAVNEKLNVFFSEQSVNRPSFGRYKCLFFHRGNYPHNFEGCSGIGEKYNPAHDMVTNTTQTCRIVNTAIAQSDSRILKIIDEV
jgi:hypothetical protein